MLTSLASTHNGKQQSIGAASGAGEAHNLTTLADIAQLIGNVTWLWEPWLPTGCLTLLVGQPGVGKSFLALHLAASVLEGRQWPDGTVVDEIGPVVWVETESSQAILRQRAEAWQLPVDQIIMAHPAGEPLGTLQLRNLEHLVELERYIAEAQPSLVVVDSLRGAYSGNENSSEDVEPVMKSLATLARNWNVALLLVHHLNKAAAGSNGKIAPQAVRGSSAIAASARSIIAVDQPLPHDTGPKRLYRIKHNLVADTGVEIGFTIGDQGLVFGEAPAIQQPIAKLDEAQAFLLEQLAEGPVPTNELQVHAKQLGITIPTLKRAKSMLEIQSAKLGNHWVWQLPAAK